MSDTPKTPEEMTLHELAAAVVAVNTEMAETSVRVKAYLDAAKAYAAKFQHRYLKRMTGRFHALRVAPKSLPEITMPLPASVDFRAKLLPVKDQGAEGDCTGQGTSCLVEWVTGATAWLSAPYLYAKGRQAEGSFPADNGCVIADVVACANADGCCLDSLLPQTGDPAETPSPADDADAATRKIGPPLAVETGDDGTAIKINLAASKLVVIGFTVPGNFEGGIGADGIMPAPDNSPSPGGHCVVVVGYNVDDAGTLWLWIRNSWGTGWAAAGYFTAKWADIAPLISEAWTA